MAIYLPSSAEEQAASLDELTPREIVAELDKYVVGQNDAKRAVAIALRNRMRRQKLPDEMAEEVIPKNIIMIGPTRRGKDGDRAAAGQAREFAVPESGGIEVYRSRLRGSRRRVDDSRPG